MSKGLVRDEELLLELLNSTPVVDGWPRDELADDDAVRRWSRRHDGPGDEAEGASVRAARAVLQDLARGVDGPEALAPLLGGVVQVPEPHAGGVSWHLHAPPSQQVAARAVLAWAELASTLPGRLRPCGNDECRLFFVDRSRAGTGRWCSMAVCGNRMKARRHQARGRSGTP